MRLALVLCAALLALPAAASAAPSTRDVLVLSEDGRTRVRPTPFSGPLDLPGAAGRAPAPPRARARAAARKTVSSELARLRDSGALDAARYDELRATYSAARSAAGRLSGTRRSELRAVVRTVEDIARRGQLSLSRLGPLFLTLERNREWWTTGALLANGRRIEFEGSELVWQYYAGQGLQLQPLANFGKLNGFWTGGRRYNARMGAMMDELLPLAANRGGGAVWEYYFTFAGGRPPWASGMAQGTAVQALARAATRLGRQADVFPVAQKALVPFRQAPPTGVRVASGDGAHYLLYSYDRRLFVLNGFIQALIGLRDYATLTGDPAGEALFAEGDRSGRRETPTFDTGAWSLYARGSVTRESDLSYHDLLTGFLRGLCTRTGAAPYCSAAQHFTTYKTQPPVLTLRPSTLRAGRSGRLRFSLSKLSNVGMQLAKDGTVAVSRSALIGYGRRSFGFTVPRSPGTYTVRLTATDMAGNPAAVSGTVEVQRARRSGS